MTTLLNDPKDFPRQLAAGFVEANPGYVRAVFGGVVRATQSRPGKVAVISGGGTGHYPAFTGWVGQGLLDGAVTGNIFSSPSASQAVSVARAADQGGGVLIAFLNYAGDVLHFGQAAERLRAENIEVATAVVTDDVASAPATTPHMRRGIAGGLPVLKITSAAAEAGLPLDEVVDVFHNANSRVQTFGVAFSGCTLPGADHPLFEVPKGQIGVGLGVHGEAGIYETDLGTADDVAGLLVDRLLEERPADGTRVVAMLNGLGSAKYEELFVAYTSVAERLRRAGVEIVDGEVGEFMTSLDMGGVSLTLIWLNEVIEPYYFAECDTPAYRRRTPMAPALADDVVFNTEAEQLVVTEPATEDSRQAARLIVEGLARISEAIEANATALGDLDAIAGDGDHGIGMTRGSAAAARAARELFEQGAGAQTVLVGAGDRWSENAGGASGALWGAALTAAGNALGNSDYVDGDLQTAAVNALVDAIQRLGGAQLGDKTMLDAMVPFAETFAQAVSQGMTTPVAWQKAADAADAAAAATADLKPRLGRARVLSERSIGHADPGAVSFALAARTMAGAVQTARTEEIV
ncbi:dihydroxyacetone kinase subunit DhaL [Microbacterium sp. UBA3394]|uniref:dihydroxyacetone kinase subunit DhaL n=1 Tax=Microbacterium sp. UBA3394 TaxID=1946945 RepID=UPI000C6B6E76|nr:dihydroxyacetone kinase subunit DhaL [Microbacterium sp. UBA3394]MAM53357.1 dihydroxyacetone kinase subunit L [Microbacterium sp.]HAS30870.1 dihydroxyacetone kinase subunit L [Microbacterium sp.]|tara:strand:- start:5560 stop:7293 length:1734 start_codon:yes stop_codon:yes gene_type:complete